MSLILPSYIQFYPTNRCNQTCRFCFNKDEDASAEMTYDEAADLLKILSLSGIREIDIMGGEPFVLNWMPDFIRTAQKQSLRINVSTNGSLPDELKRLKGTGSENLTIGISLEGSDAEKHNGISGSENFQRAVESIGILLGLGLDPLVKTVVNRQTAGDLQAIAALLKKLRVRRYYLIHMDLMQRDAFLISEAMCYADFLSIYEKMKDENQGLEIHRVNASCFARDSLPPGARCAGGVRKLCIMPDGSVYPCNLFQGISEMKLGNIFQHDFAKIWSSPKLNYFRTYQENRCTKSGCDKRESCTGGCPAHGLYHFGNLDSPDIRCLDSGDKY